MVIFSQKITVLLSEITHYKIICKTEKWGFEKKINKPSPVFEVVVVRGVSQIVSLIHPHTGKQHMINKQFPEKNIIHSLKKIPYKSILSEYPS